MTEAEFEAILAAGRSGTIGAQAASALGVAAIERRREDEILAVLTPRAERERSDPTLWHVIGLMHRALGDLASAITALDRAMAVRAPTPKLLHARAHAAREAGLSSIGLYRRARAAAPNDGEVILGEAAALASEGERMAADKLLVAMLRVHPGWYPGHAALIKLRHAWNRAECFAAIDQAIEGCPGDWQLHHIKAVSCLRANAGDAARAAVADATRACGQIAPLLGLTAMIATEFGTLAEADAAFAACGQSEDADVTLFRLRHWIRRGEPERIVDRYAAGLETVPAAEWPYLSIAWRLLGDTKAAWLDQPCLIREVDLDIDASAAEALTTKLRALHHVSGQPIDQSVRGGTQTDGPLFSRVDREIAAIRDKCRDAVVDYIAALPPSDAAHPLLKKIPASPRFVGSWSVRLVGEGYHAPHVHTHGWLSSALYIAVPDNPGSDAGSLVLGAPDPSLRTALPHDRVVHPSPCKLVLFPSTLWHGTLPFAAGERLTIAFDVA